MEPLRPLVQTINTLDTGAGSQDSVFGVGGGSTDSVSSLKSQEQKDFKLLRSSCSMQEILEAMRNPNTGLSFVSKNTTSLPQSTFVSAEAVMWLMEHVEGVTSEKRAGDFNKPNTFKDYAFKSFTVDIDGVGKSERPEWGEGKYQGKYRPDKAFELRVNWSVATGAIITELVSNWARKAQSNGLSIIPIPRDPFALPQSEQ